MISVIAICCTWQGERGVHRYGRNLVLAVVGNEDDMSHVHGNAEGPCRAAIGVLASSVATGRPDSGANHWTYSAGESVGHNVRGDRTALFGNAVLGSSA